MLRGCEVDETGSGSFKIAGFGIRAVETLCSAARYSVNCLYLSEPHDCFADGDRGTSMSKP